MSIFPQTNECLSRHCLVTFLFRLRACAVLRPFLVYQYDPQKNKRRAEIFPAADFLSHNNDPDSDSNYGWDIGYRRGRNRPRVLDDVVLDYPATKGSTGARFRSRSPWLVLSSCAVDRLRSSTRAPDSRHRSVPALGVLPGDPEPP